MFVLKIFLRDHLISLPVVGPDFADIDLIIGCDLLEENELTLIYRARKASDCTFAQLLQTDV